MKRVGFWVYDLYNYIFDSRLNPLRHIPNAFTQFILMFYLSVMWTAVFTIYAGQTIFFLSDMISYHSLAFTLYRIQPFPIRRNMEARKKHVNRHYRPNLYRRISI